MATQLDLQEQEQVDALKAFWSQYGNLITWTLTLALAAFAGYNYWQKHQRDQSALAGTMFDELERAAAAGDADKTGKVFGDLKEHYPRTIYAVQGGLLAARVQNDKAKPEAALASLAWVAEHGDDEYKAVARLRWAGLLADAKKYDEALAQLDLIKVPAFAALASDRRGDVLLIQGKKDAAKAAYLAAWNGMDATVKYRFVVESKLTALAAAPSASAASAASGATQ
jgi:predicted negative regulator of RcsB-dependent stress response